MPRLTRLRVASILIGLPLAGVAISSLWIFRDLPDLSQGKQLTFQELACARVTLGVLGLLILWVPFQQRRRWAWLALLLFEVLYFIPAWILPFRQGLADLRGLISEITVSRFAQVELENLAAGLCVAIGLVLSLTEFFRQRE
jgi:hypothetical protein